MYTTKNFKSKAELKRALAAGDKITIFQPGPFGGNESQKRSSHIGMPTLPRTTPLVRYGHDGKWVPSQSQIRIKL